MMVSEFIYKRFQFPNANSRFSGKKDMSSFHGHVTLYLSSSNLSVSLKILSAVSLSDSRGESIISKDFQKSSRFGFVDRHVSGVKRHAPFRVFELYDKTRILGYVISSAGS